MSGFITPLAVNPVPIVSVGGVGKPLDGIGGTGNTTTKKKKKGKKTKPQIKPEVALINAKITAGHKAVWNEATQKYIAS